ncbi:MAG: hypothetical protein LLG37_02305 [Spirochaetia bacterium]|nr:hypothetical protein [Spirochaetia bacterium]
MMENTLTSIFRAASRNILRGLSFRKIGVNGKGDITKYFDKFTENLIIGMLRKSGIRAAVISEELSAPLIINPHKKTPLYYIIIDPVDGSDNYLSGVPWVCLGIAVFDEKMEPAYSLAGNYYTGEWFYADREKLLYNGKIFNAEKAAKEPADMILFACTDTVLKTGGTFREEIFHDFGIVRSLGATVGELMLVVRGGAKCFIDVRGKLTPENFAPFFLIARHAKAVLTDEHGNEFGLRNLDLTEEYNVIMSNNERVHSEAVGKIKKFL